MSYYYGLLVETATSSTPGQTSLTVRAQTPKPTADVALKLGVSGSILSTTPRPVAKASLAVSTELLIAARTPQPIASAALAAQIQAAISAVTPRPTARIYLAEPVKIGVTARTPPPLAALRGFMGTPVAQTATPPAASAVPAPVVGSLDDMMGRVKALLPRRWFPDTTPVLDGLVAGGAQVWAWAWSLLQYVALQRRITTATDANLDLVSQDYFAGNLPRHASEGDDTFKARIKANLFAERATRAGVSSAVEALTGQAPVIFEPANTQDTGGYGSLSMSAPTGLAYDLAGGWGSLGLPFQAFISAHRPTGGGVPSVQGYASFSALGAIFNDGSTVAQPVDENGLPLGLGGFYQSASGLAQFYTAPPAIGAYDQGAIEYASLPSVVFTVSDADIYATISGAKPAATIMWTSISDVTPSIALLNINFVLNASVLK